MSETLVESKPFEYYLNLAKTAPKIPADDGRVLNYLAALENANKPEEIKSPGHEQFGNNFYLLFLAIQQAGDNPANILVKTYLESAKAYGVRWQAFLTNNQDLLRQIEQALNETKPYSELLQYYTGLLFSNQEEKAEKLKQETGHKLGIEAIGILAWDKLNPLLEKAAKKLEKVGINPEEFFV